MYYHPRYKELREEIELSYLEEEVYNRATSDLITSSSDIEISLESFIGAKKMKQYFIQFIKWLKDQIIKLFYYLKNKLGKWIRSKIFRRQLKIVNTISEIGYLKDNELSDMVSSYFRNKITLSVESFNEKETFDNFKSYLEAVNKRSYKLGYLFTSSGKIRELPTLFSRVDEVISDLNNLSDEDIIRKYRLSSDADNLLSWTKLDFYFKEYCFEGNLLNEYKDNFKLDVNNFYYRIENFEKDFKLAENKFAKLKDETIRNADKLVKELDDGMYNYDNKARNEAINKLQRQRLALVCCDIPVSFIMNFAELIQYVAKTSLSEKYTTTDIPPSSDLFHVSINDNIDNARTNPNKMGMMVIRETDTGSSQFLPNRISFSPTPIKCFFGIPRHVNHHGTHYENGIWVARLHLYRGIPIPNVTRYLREELVRFAIFADELDLTEEICVSNKIQINYMGEVEYYYNPRAPMYDSNRLINTLLYAEE